MITKKKLEKVRTTTNSFLNRERKLGKNKSVLKLFRVKLMMIKKPTGTVFLLYS